ncbi:hypothetical protein BCR34DRAFT_571984 [Clohesyomyces aquaticus]|uniref:Uncharacterized protein n=1 Tax=Clohesyomyces aquaticus TaxID=1231657 RepID=A0A1Y1Z4Z7_9PLEO|nr:hypothetical protein BCR34DRAFT_571984 [Clohesyomyces aquaticus]
MFRHPSFPYLFPSSTVRLSYLGRVRGFLTLVITLLNFSSWHAHTHLLHSHLGSSHITHTHNTLIYNPSEPSPPAYRYLKE